MTGKSGTQIRPLSRLIKEFLLANKAEVKDMCLTEYNEVEVMEKNREEIVKKDESKSRPTPSTIEKSG